MNPKIDAYIEKSAEFAQPILHHLRELVHTACPEVVESIKWSFPNFEYAGSLLCHMAAFKQHCTFGFFKGALLEDPNGALTATGEQAMGHLGRITSLSDLPPDGVLIGLIQQAMRLNEEKISIPKKKSEKKDLEIPEYFLQALERHEKAREVFEKFSYSHRRDYLEWIAEAKTEATRDKRLQQAMEWMAEGKGRNWKYEKK